tara:strand:- start:50 stop:841 length:792 start_codon:yes stop_codon:yes gene_type:complete
MASTLLTCTSSTRPGSPSTGDTLFETDTKSIIVYSGTAWRGYNSGGFALGANGYSLDLDGTDDRVELGTVSFLNSSSGFSISTWVKSSDTSATQFFFQSGSDTFYNAIGFYRGGSGMDLTLGKGGSAYYGVRYSGEIFDGSWKHVVAVFADSAASLYINGSLATTAAIGSSSNSTAVSTAGQDARIGGKTDDTLCINGKLDDFALFSAALTATEVSNIYTSRIYNPAKLEHLYKFENNYNDSEGSLNGTAQGNPTFDSSDKPY